MHKRDRPKKIGKVWLVVLKADNSFADFLTRYCGLFPPALFERVGIMAADGHRR